MTNEPLNVSRVYLHTDKEAALIAAAPDLLAALRECMAHMDSLRDFVSEGGSRTMIGATAAILAADVAFAAGLAAIAKAEDRHG